MKLENNEYINEKFIDIIIGKEDLTSPGKITDFSIIFNNDLYPINTDQFDLEIFFGVPGYRLIETILEKSEVNLKIKNETSIYFEYEKNIKYFLNKNNIVHIKPFPNNIWKIQMVEETLWFSANPQNIKIHLLNKLN